MESAHIRMTSSLSTWLKKLAANPARVAADLDCPVLLWEEGLFSPEEGSDLTLTASGGASFNPTPDNPLVLVVRAQTTQSSSPAISVGRSETSDLIVHNRSVSRLHAILHHDLRGDRWVISDANSHNGTEVDGAVVSGEVPVPLADGARLRLGDVELRFLLPGSFLKHLEARRRA